MKLTTPILCGKYCISSKHQCAWRKGQSYLFWKLLFPSWMGRAKCDCRSHWLRETGDYLAWEADGTRMTLGQEWNGYRGVYIRILLFHLLTLTGHLTCSCAYESSERTVKNADSLSVGLRKEAGDSARLTMSKVMLILLVHGLAKIRKKKYWLLKTYRPGYRIPTLTFTLCVALGELPLLTDPQFIAFTKNHNKVHIIIRLLCGLYESVQNRYS